MSDNPILNLFKNCIFDGELHSDVVYTKVLNRLPRGFKYTWEEGLSKLVIIPFRQDYVIKIPYNGRVIPGHGYRPFASACAKENYTWDYCLAETLIWKAAKAENLHRAFAKERMIGTINNHPIYIQQKAEIYADVEFFSDEDEGEYENKIEQTVNYCSREGITIFDESTLAWEADAFEYYGATKFNKIMAFLQKNSIEDLHRANIGYIDNKPVFVDYSDFLE